MKLKRIFCFFFLTFTITFGYFCWNQGADYEEVLINVLNISFCRLFCSLLDPLHSVVTWFCFRTAQYSAPKTSRFTFNLSTLVCPITGSLTLVCCAADQWGQNCKERQSFSELQWSFASNSKCQGKKVQQWQTESVFQGQDVGYRCRWESNSTLT